MTKQGAVGTHRVGSVRIRNNPPGQYSDPPLSEYVLCLCERGSGRSEFDFGEGWVSYRSGRGMMGFAPPNQALASVAEHSFDVTVLSLPPELLEEAWTDLGPTIRPRSLKPLHAQAFRDPFIFDLGLRISDEVAEGNPSGRLYADSLTHLIAASLLRLASDIRIPQDNVRPLDAHSLGLVTENMEDRMAERVGMAELARLIDMNVYGFSRAFRAATGMSPHQYLTDRRIARIKVLLETTDEPLASIALDCGYSSQSHMTAAFTKHVGVPPGAWRRARIKG
ncbi:MAG: AraC family transcriptional regulator [Pseudomonadota bacterium]